MKSYFKFLSRYLFYTLIEAAGLAVSLAFLILIGCYAWQQYAITTVHPDRKDIYIPGMPDVIGLTYGFKGVAEERVPEIERVVNVMVRADWQLKLDDTIIEPKTIGAERAFFDMFPYCHILEGSADALLSKDAVLVSRTFANALDLKLGSTLQFMDNEGETKEMTVGGIVEDFRNMTFRYVDIIANPESFFFYTSTTIPFSNFTLTLPIIKLKPGSDVEAVRHKLEDICKEVYPDVYGEDFFEYLTLTRLDKIHFSEMSIYCPIFCDVDLKTLRRLMLVGLLLLLSSVFNYVNLNTALVGRRAKEMAVRRLVGAQRAAIIGRYIGESIGFTALCFGMALLLAMAFAPVLRQLIYHPYTDIAVVFTPATVTGFLLLILLVGILSGLLPALLASRFRPIDIVKGKFKMHNKMTFSRVFIVLQNALAVFLLAMALVMEAQYQKSLDQPIHANIADKYLLRVKSDYNKEALQDALSALPCVRRIGRVVGAPGYMTYVHYSRTKDGEEIRYWLMYMDSTAFSMFDFEKKLDFNAPLYNSVWFGESSFKATGFDEEYHDISQTLAQSTLQACEQVAGTIVDFACNFSNEVSGSFEPYPVVAVVKSEDMPEWFDYLIETVGDHKEARQQILETYAKWIKETTGMYVYPYYSFYLTDQLTDSLRPARNNMRLLEIFMMLAILISVLGLVAMSTYYVGEQAKSIAIRKAFGGTVVSETIKNVRFYMLMVGVACMVALPPAVWVADKYVERFVYRIENYWWIFFMAVVLAMAIAFAAVFWQVWSAARTNPVVELKKE